jgi:hypothetical protein
LSFAKCVSESRWPRHGSFANSASEIPGPANINTRINAEVILLAARLLSHIKGRLSRPCFGEEITESQMQLGRLIDAAFERYLVAINNLPFRTNGERPTYV